MCELPIEIKEPVSDSSVVVMKVCRKCGIEKPSSEFYDDSEYLHPRCKKCHNHARSLVRKLYRTAPPMPDHCECCGRHAKNCPKGILVLDHDYSTGTFRGWICETCNIGIGKLGDNVDGLLNAIKYLERKNKFSVSQNLFKNENQTLKNTSDLDEQLGLH